ncbi:MAG TPA: hypothetical protein VFB72_04545 [Verrucomicrobiae bacterium]|nr:hypothetical protein [Verrucomicrobiae bacterium]
MITKMAAAVGIAAAMAMSAKADTILNVGVGATDALGVLVYGNIGGAGGQAADEAADVNDILALSPGGHTGTPNLNYVARSTVNYGTLSPAVTTGAALNPSTMTKSGTEILITIGNTGYGYLTARWDGPNAGAEVWDISGIVNTTIDIPEYAQPNASGTDLVNGAYNGQYQITSYTLFNPGTTPPPVLAPEVTSTIALLGGALAGLGLLRKKLAAK